jgi:hypothetical protein
MKRIKLSFVAIATLTLSTLSCANTLSEALSNGKITGDVSATYEVRKQDKELNAYYSDTAYSVGSIGLNYETATFNNFSANIGFRAYTTLYEDDDKGAGGAGDASERFYQVDGKNKTSDVEKAYIAYDLDNIHFKFGRQFISTEWINKTHDAVSVNATFGDSDLELIHSQRQGRIYSRDYRPMTDINAGNNGVTKIGFTQNLSDDFSAKAYYLTASKLKDITGAKINLKIGDIQTMAHYAKTKEDVVNVKDSNILELKTSTSFAGYSATLAYIKIDKDAAFNHIAGETINPFEEGDQIYLKDAQTTYFMLSKKIADISLTGLYGVTKYGEFSKDEFNLWAGYEMAKNFNLNVGYAFTNEDKDDASTTDLSQFNATVAYKF